MTIRVADLTPGRRLAAHGHDAWLAAHGNDARPRGAARGSRLAALASGVRLAALFTCLSGAMAIAAQAPGVVVRDAWIRESEPPGSSAAYFILENRGAAAARLVSAEVDGVKTVEIHEMKMTGDMMGMAKRDGVDVPPGVAIEFKAGGLHLMLFELRRAFRPGDTATVTLRFASGPPVKVQARVRKRSETGA